MNTNNFIKLLTTITLICFNYLLNLDMIQCDGNETLTREQELEKIRVDALLIILGILAVLTTISFYMYGVNTIILPARVMEARALCEDIKRRVYAMNMEELKEVIQELNRILRTPRA